LATGFHPFLLYLSYGGQFIGNIGAKPLSLDQLLECLNRAKTCIAEIIIFEGRLPRTLKRLFVGMALAPLVQLIQGTHSQPLADHRHTRRLNLGAIWLSRIAIAFSGGYSAYSILITRR